MPCVKACLDNVSDTRRATTIRQGEAVVHTTEHLLAALAAAGIDNLRIEMDGPEPPVDDGSAVLFERAIREAGATSLGKPSEPLVVRSPVSYEQGETILVALPRDAPGLRVSCTVRYNQNVMDTQFLSVDVTAETFAAELSKARTFCLYSEIEALMTADLIRGGSLDNAVVIKGDVILSREGLRYPDEFVRHKILDVVGDLFLIGHPVQAHIVAVKPGHPSNIALASRLLASSEGS